MSVTYDAVIIGGGIIGASTALNLLWKKDYSILILEAEDKLSAHQTGNNSGVIHSGLYYKPGSLKAVNCVEGRNLLYEFCNQYNVKYEKCGKIVVAVSENELPALNELEKRGAENGLAGVRRLNGNELKEYEPFVNGIAGLLVPETGIVNYTDVVNAYAGIIQKRGGAIKTGCRFESAKESGNEIIIKTNKEEIKAKLLINCAGLQSDRVAKFCDADPQLQIIPFRGEYYQLKKEKEHLVKNLIYPVPDHRFPFLGVHFTRMINGGIEAGPNAVLAFKREGYSHKEFSFNDTGRMLAYPGFWQMAKKYYKTGFDEFRRSLSKKLFVKALQKLIPELCEEDVIPNGAGVRAQAVDPSGNLLDDFRIIETKNMVHVLNAPSPAATASLSIGRKIAQMAASKI